MFNPAYIHSRDNFNKGLRAVLGGSDWAAAADEYSDIPALSASLQWSDPEDTMKYWEAPAAAPGPSQAPGPASGGTPVEEPPAPAGNANPTDAASAKYYKQGIAILFLVTGF